MDAEVLGDGKIRDKAQDLDVRRGWGEVPDLDGNRGLAWGRVRPEKAVRGGPEEPDDTKIPVNGDYVASKADANSLFVVNGGQLERISPPQALDLGVEQAQIQFVDPLVIAAYPLAVARGAVDETFHLTSDLRGGHLGETWAWFEGGTFYTRTITQAVTWFGGWTMGLTALLVGPDGEVIPEVKVKTRYGIDGRAFGSGRRDDTEAWAVPADVAGKATKVLLLHYPDPKTKWVEALVEATPYLLEVAKIILEAQLKGVEVNCGWDCYQGI
jgi:hypothetical protein